MVSKLHAFYLIWESMKPLVEKFGPDVIIFPNLLGQPLFDRWICELKFNNQTFRDLLNRHFGNESWFRKFIDNAYSEEKLTIANLPNRFLAVIPYDKERNWAKECEKTFQRKLEELSGKVYRKVCFYIFLHNLYELKNKGIIIPVPSDDKDLFEEGLERAFIESLGNSNPNTIFNFLSEWKFEVEKIMEFVNSEFLEVLKLGNKLVPMIIKHLSSYFQVY